MISSCKQHLVCLQNSWIIRIRLQVKPYRVSLVFFVFIQEIVMNILNFKLGGINCEFGGIKAKIGGINPKIDRIIGEIDRIIPKVCGIRGIWLGKFPKKEVLMAHNISVGQL